MASNAEDAKKAATGSAPAVTPVGNDAEPMARSRAKPRCRESTTAVPACSAPTRHFHTAS